jgi:hypothetical protein
LREATYSDHNNTFSYIPFLGSDQTLYFQKHSQKYLDKILS